jgi:hypothetical protein
LGYLPKVLFFNAFELGAESANQVISSDEVLVKSHNLVFSGVAILTKLKVDK